LSRLHAKKEAAKWVKAGQNEDEWSDPHSLANHSLIQGGAHQEKGLLHLLRPSLASAGCKRNSLQVLDLGVERQIPAMPSNFV
jgi:hypothetical protein